jgi:hypothetical protein
VRAIIFLFSLIIGEGLGLFENQALAQSKNVKGMTDRLPASTEASGVIEGKESIEIRGQSRTLSMGLMIQSKKEKLRFVEPRRNYRDEILNTNY